MSINTLMTSMYFKFKVDIHKDTQRVVHYFFKDWVDNTCNREVDYKNIEDTVMQQTMSTNQNTFRVDFDKPQDAVALKLKGLPNEFAKFIEIIK